MLIQMKVKGMVFDPYSNAYIVILRDEKDEYVLPIWIGRPEAISISFAVEGSFSAKPMVHDLMKSILEVAGASMISVVITDIEENTYYAKLHMLYNNSEITIDSRPSDAIALALRTKAPIFASNSVIKKHSSDELDKWLDNFRPEDFGNYEA